HGREVWLSEGRLSIGERECDLCIPLLVASRIELAIADGQLYVNAEKVSVRVNGRRHIQHHPLPSQGVLEAAGLAMAFGPQQADLAGYCLPARRFSNGWVLVPGMLMLILALFSFALEWVPPPSTEAPVNVSALLQQAGLTQLVAKWQQDGVLHVSGDCESSDTLTPLWLVLQSRDIRYQNDVICADQLVLNVKDVLIQAGYAQARVVSRGQGNVAIDADIRMGEQWAAVQPLLADIPGLRHWQIENPYDEIGNALISALLQQGLADKVNLTNRGSHFILSGVLNVQDKQTLTQLMQEMLSRYPAVALSYQDVPLSNEFSRQLPAPVTGIVHSRRGDYLVLGNGDTLSIGSRLADGSEVVAISDRAVTFRQGRTLITLPFNF
ncbi:type III secretion system inner membrane ring subunit SctD, partial [Candidatus Symbiopectobacterium sp. NZEC135]|uniref:type III secretion system inner membrane ring subunit SctD n=1 Tax=Candidatus Symbiopectobacterium sp. NZEC135 TaxID=2820471 RepID=UPI002226B6BF